MYIDEKELKKKHKGDIPTLWEIYVSDRQFYKNKYFIISFISAIIALLLGSLSEISYYELILKVANLGISLIPSLLGFNLGAYILIVGFGGTEILSVITKPLEQQKKFSFYQKLNGVLGISVITQIITLFCAFSLNVWDNLQLGIDCNYDIKIIYWWATLINILVYFILIFLSLYSILLLISVVKHVFMFAQTIHFCITVNKLKEGGMEENSKKNQE